MKTAGRTANDIATEFIKPDESVEAVMSNANAILIGSVSVRHRFGKDRDGHLKELRRQLARLITSVRKEADGKGIQ